MLVSRPTSNLLKFMIPAFLIFATTYYLFHTPDQVSLPGYHFAADPANSPAEHQEAIPAPPEQSGPPVITKEHLKQEFIQDIVDHEIDGPINLDPLTQLCAKTQWQAGLFVKCQPLPGGIGNVRNMMLNCIRFAIDAGATGLVMPECRHRNVDDLSDIHTTNLYPLSYLIDTEYFTKTFSTACPQMKIYPTDADLPMKVTPELEFNYSISPFLLSPTLHAGTLIDLEPAEWRSSFDTWLRNETRYPNLSAENPAFVYSLNCLLRWPFKFDTNDFVAHFGRILKNREDTKRIAGAVLWSMSEKYAMNLDFATPNIPAAKFMGAHLRTAADATKVGWPGYDSQEANYLHSANRTDAKLIYLTTGAPDDAKRFTKKAKEQGVEVISKEMMLKGKDFTEERKALEKMTWDQRALVDFEVLLRSSYFVGMFESSFTWNIALRRHIIIGKGTWLPIAAGNQGLEGMENPAEAFMDQYSAVFGPVDLGIRWQFPLGLFP